MPPPTKAEPTEKRFADIVDRVATTAERFGAPTATLAVGASLIIFGATRPTLGELVPVGAALMLAALGVYVWLTQRSTTRLPPVVPEELMQELRWLHREMSDQNHWFRMQLDLKRQQLPESARNDQISQTEPRS
jgi:hypothetical protein